MNSSQEKRMNSRFTLFPRRKKSEEKRPEKRPFKIAWPWRKRPKPQPKPLELLRLELSRMRQRVAGLCQRCSDSARRLHQALTLALALALTLTLTLTLTS